MVVPGLVKVSRWCWSAGESLWVGGVGRIEGDPAGIVDGGGGAEVERRWGMPCDPGVAVGVVVLGEESFAELARVLDAGEGTGEVVQVLQRPELSLGVIPQSG